VKELAAEPDENHMPLLEIMKTWVFDQLMTSLQPANGFVES